MVRTIPRGETRTYGDLANSLRAPGVVYACLLYTSRDYFSGIW